MRGIKHKQWPSSWRAHQPNILRLSRQRLLAFQHTTDQPFLPHRLDASVRVHTSPHLFNAQWRRRPQSLPEWPVHRHLPWQSLHWFVVGGRTALMLEGSGTNCVFGAYAFDLVNAAFLGTMDESMAPLACPLSSSQSLCMIATSLMLTWLCCTPLTKHFFLPCLLQEHIP